MVRSQTDPQDCPQERLHGYGKGRRENPLTGGSGTGGPTLGRQICIVLGFEGQRDLA